MAWSLSSILSFLQTFAVDASITQANLVDFIRLRYERIFNEALKYYKTEETFATINGTRYYYVPRRFSLSHGVRFFNESQPENRIKIVDWEQILKADPDQDETGTPEYAAIVEVSPTQRQPSEASEVNTMRVRSSNSADTNTVTLAGRVRDANSSRDFETTEQITLTGTTNVITSNHWVYLRQFSKHLNSTGHILLFDSSNTNLYGIIDPYESQSEYQKWRFWPTPTAADTIRAVGYRKPVIPQNASGRLDVPQDLEASFIHGLRADIHDINFDMIKAQKYEGMFEAGLQKFKDKMLLFSDEIVTEGEQEDEDYTPLRYLEDVAEDIEV